MSTITDSAAPRVLVLPDAMSCHVKMSAPTGSREVCNPPPLNTDDDWVVLVSDMDAFASAAAEQGWACARADSAEGGFSATKGFESFRGPDAINLIATVSDDFYRRFDAATHVARRLNLLNKPDRIALFEAVLHGDKWHEPGEACAKCNQPQAQEPTRE